MTEQTSAKEPSSVQSGPYVYFAHGYCIYRWEGTRWMPLSCACAAGYICPMPPGGPGSYLGQSIYTECVLPARIFRLEPEPPAS